MQTVLADLSRWDDLKILLVVYREGSLKHAAARLGVNVSTVGRRLDALEEELGVHLFDRTTDGTRPTAAAERLLPFAESAEQAVVGAGRALEGFEAEPDGEVKITAPPGLADHFLASRIGKLVQRHPKLRVTILASVGYADLTRREADIALRAIRPASGDLLAVRLATHAFIAIAAPKIVAEVGRLRDPDAVRWVTWGEDLAHLPDARWIDANVSPQQVVLRTSSMSSQIEAVRSGLGVMLAPVPYGALRGVEALTCGAKVRASLGELPRGDLWLVGHRALREVPRIAAAWDWLLEVIRTV